MTMGLYEIFLQPFVEFGFMRRALVACVALALGSAPMGTLLVLRRMSLMGDAMAHAVLPGAAISSVVRGTTLSRHCARYVSSAASDWLSNV